MLRCMHLQQMSHHTCPQEHAPLLLAQQAHAHPACNGERTQRKRLQAVRRQVLAQCPVRLTALDGQRVSDAERRLMSLMHDARPAGAWAAHSPNLQSATRAGSASGAAGGSSGADGVPKGGAKGRQRGARGSGKHGGRVATASGDANAGAVEASAQLRPDGELVIIGNALHALAVCVICPPS